MVKAIDHTDISVERGEFVAVVGRSGSGKSTLLHMLGGLDRPDSGKVFIEGRDIFGLKDEQLAIFRRRKIGFIFQDYNLMPALNVWENIVLPIGLDGKRVNKDYVMSIVKSIGMEDRLTATPSMLSGGQKQRVAIARAIASRPAIILADEPTGNLDADTAREIAGILQDSAHGENRCVVVVTHDHALAKRADVILRLKRGVVSL